MKNIKKMLKAFDQRPNFMNFKTNEIVSEDWELRIFTSKVIFKNN